MKYNSYALCSALMLLYTMPMLVADAPVATYLPFRSQGRDTGRKLAGTTSHHVYLDDMESFYGTLNMTMQYDRSFRSHDIDQALFGSSLYNTPSASSAAKSCNDGGFALIVSGMLTPDRNNSKDWMAENFLLPTDFKSMITFSPLVQDFLVDFNLYVGLDEWVKGLYFRVYGPIVNNKTRLNPEETIVTQGSSSGSYPQGYFSSQNQVSNTQLFKSALQFFNGNQLIAPIDNITYIPLAYAKISPCGTHSKTGFAELRGELGWNYLDEDYHFGFNIQSAAPTGKRPNPEFLFGPEVGNGKHWELGIGLSGHWTMWRSEDEEQHCDLVFEADITHLFNAKQTRTFDLIDKSNSRYMLAEKLSSNKGSTNPLNGSSNAGVEFANTYTPVANFSTRSVSVNIGVQGDAVAMFNYTSRGFSWDLGYNIWGISREKITLSDCDNPFPFNTWSLKGDASIGGTAPLAAGNAVTVLLAATESSATIHSGTNIFKTTGPLLTNPGIDSATGATTADGLTQSADVNAFGITPATQINISSQPIFIQESDLNLKGAEVAGFSNKLFTHLSYTWIDREDWIPYFGIGFNAEFGNFNNHHSDNEIMATNNSCADGVKFALSKWAVLIKGGVSFD